MTDTWYPCTYAADYVRGLAGYNQEGTKLSRSDAAQIRQAFARILDMSDEKLAILLAEAELSKTEEDRDKAILEFFAEAEGK